MDITAFMLTKYKYQADLARILL